MGAAGFGGPHMRNDLSDRVESGNLLEGCPGRFWEVRLAIGVRLLRPGTFAARIIVGLDAKYVRTFVVRTYVRYVNTW